MNARTVRFVVCAAAAGLLLTVAAPRAAGQAVIKVSDDVNFKFGVLGQFQGDTLEDPGTNGRINNLFVRRIRLLFGGQVAKNVTFFVETDSPNLGRTMVGIKNIGSTTILQDAYGEFKASDALMLDAGLMYVPFAHNFIQSGATLLPMDYGPYTFALSGGTQSNTGRDTGFQARGYFLKNHLEYRVGAFQGARDTRSHRPFRYAGRAQVNLLEAETGFFYAGTYLGKKKILSFGGAFDSQKDYHAYDADLFADHPLGPGAVTLQVNYNRLNGGTTVAGLPRQNNLLFESGYLVSALKLTPWVQLGRRDMVGTFRGDETRVAIGVNYWWTAHNANVKAAFTRIDPSRLPTQNEFTVQLQLFYF